VLKNFFLLLIIQVALFMYCFVLRMWPFEACSTHVLAFTNSIIEVCGVERNKVVYTRIKSDKY
jgi:hypothetical protein